MGWLKLDDQRLLHPKLMAAGPYAELLDVRGMLYCARHETDGHLEPALISLIGVGIPAAKKRAAELVQAGRWHDPGHTCTECPPVTVGWYVHGYLEFNPSRDKRAQEREIARRRSAMNANAELAKYIKARDGDHCRYCAAPVNWRDRKGPTGGTYDHVIPVSQGGDEHPDNLVVACRRCNLAKGGRTPEQAGMVLLPPPGNQTRTKTGSSHDLDGNQTSSVQPVPVPRSSSKNNSARAKRDSKTERATPPPPLYEPSCERVGTCTPGNHKLAWPCAVTEVG